jgi:hypothetical protein
MIARKQEISLQLNQLIDVWPDAPAALLRKERIDIAHATMRLRRGESGECFSLAGKAHEAQEFLRSISRVILTFILIKLDKVRRAVGAREFESVEGSIGADLTHISIERPKYDPCDPCSFSETLRISPGFHCQEIDRSHHRRGVPDRSAPRSQSLLSPKQRLRAAPHLRPTKGWLSWKTLHEGQVAREIHDAKSHHPPVWSARTK